MALFRYGLISPIVNNALETTQKEYLERVSAKVHDVPYYGSREFAPKTITKWLTAYRSGGFTALKPKRRSDRGQARILDEEKKEEILKLRAEMTDMSVALFYDQLVVKKILLPSDVSYSTVNRILNNHNLGAKRQRQEADRKRFAHTKVNALWQADLSHGLYIKKGRKKRKTYLFGFIDDCSRLVTAAMFLYEENLEALLKVFKNALLRRGVPRLLYVDNGKIYRSRQMNLICASLGITLLNTDPHDPQSKGKIERVFSTVKSRFFPLQKEEEMDCLDKLNQRFWHWLEVDYHRKEHSSIHMNPLDKYLSQSSSIKTIDDPKELDFIFMKRETRKVYHDSTFSLYSALYEAPPQFIGQRIDVRFDSDDMENVYIYEDGTIAGKAKPVDFGKNAHAKRPKKSRKKHTQRNSTFSFQDMPFNKEDT